MTSWPITSRINPFGIHAGQNLIYLAASAALTRFSVGLGRTYENRGANLQKQDMTAAERKKAFWERAFVELFGTAFYVSLLHIGQDVAAKWFAWRNSNLLNDTLNGCLDEINADTTGKYVRLYGKNPDQKFARTFNKVAIPDTLESLLSNVIYGDRNTRERAGRIRICKELIGTRLEWSRKGQNLDEILPNAINELGPKINRICSKTILFGVLLSAVLGGWGVQKLNDGLISNILRHFYTEKVPPGFSNISNVPTEPEQKPESSSLSQNMTLQGSGKPSSLSGPVINSSIPMPLNQQTRLSSSPFVLPGMVRGAV